MRHGLRLRLRLRLRLWFKELRDISIVMVVIVAALRHLYTFEAKIASDKNEKNKE